MNKLKTQTTALRLAAISAWLIICTLTLVPTGVLVSDAFAAPDAKPAASAPAPASTPAAAPAPAPAAATPAPAPAAAPAETKPEPTSSEDQAWWQAALTPVLSVLGLFIAAFLAAGLRKLVQLIEKKWNIDIPDSVEKVMTEKARWAIAWVEEKTEKRLLHGDGKKTPSAEKISEVIEILTEFAQKLGYGEDWRRDKIEALAEGVLHLERDQSIGSNGIRAERLQAMKDNNL